MTISFAVSPFGEASMNAAHFSLNRRVLAERAARIDGSQQATNAHGEFDKWKLINALGVARGSFALSDRTIAVLSALLSVLPGRTLNLEEEQIVFPSNAELSRRTNGMADATLRRHIVALIEAGLLLRRDSPNGKRYARRNDAGQIEAAFGFDLGPLALRAAEIFALEETVKSDHMQMRRLRDEISIHIRDMVKIIDTAIVEGRAGDWHGFLQRLAPLGIRLRRTASMDQLTARRDSLMTLRAEVEKTWLDCLSEEEMSGNDRDFERQLQNSNTESYIESGFEEKLKRPVVVKGVTKGIDSGEEGDLEIKGAKLGGEGRVLTGAQGSHVQGSGLPALSTVLALCPQINDYAKHGIASWADLETTANLVRAMLGISPDAWMNAINALGASRAAIVMAAMLERADKIRVPGGYLRAITARAAIGAFSVTPMLEALRAKDKERG